MQFLICSEAFPSLITVPLPWTFSTWDIAASRASFALAAASSDLLEKGAEPSRDTRSSAGAALLLPRRKAWSDAIFFDIFAFRVFVPLRQKTDEKRIRHGARTLDDDCARGLLGGLL